MRVSVIVCLVAGGCSFAPNGAVSDAPGPSDTPSDQFTHDDVHPDTSALDAGGRVQAGLAGLFSFDEGSGTTVTDTSADVGLVTLTIADPSTVTWGSGELELDKPAIVASPPSTQSPILTACKAANGLTVEAWIVPASTSQDGKAGEFARVVTASTNAGSRNFAIGQHGSSWSLEARTTGDGNSGQGAPILSGGTVIPPFQT